MQILNSIDNPSVYIFNGKCFEIALFEKIKKDDIILRSYGDVIALNDACFSIDLPEGTLEIKTRMVKSGSET